MVANRTILISTVQYEDALKSGATSLVDLAKTARRLGVAGVEFRDVYWQNKTREIPAVREAISAAGLIATYATFATLFDATANAPVLREAIDDAAALGSPLVRIFPGPVAAADDAAGWRAATAIVDYARERGVTIAVENFAGKPGSRVDEVKAVLDRFQSPSVGTNLDIGNYAANGQDILAAIAILGSRIVSTHLKDISPGAGGATALGDGSLPIAAIVGALDRLPQRILNCFEFGGGDDPDERVTRSLAVLREIS